LSLNLQESLERPFNSIDSIALKELESKKGCMSSNYQTIRRREGDLFLIAGPRVIESEGHALTLETLLKIHEIAQASSKKTEAFLKN
jgi:hypothetical protein